MYEVITEHTMTYTDYVTDIKRTLLQFLGAFSYGAAGIQFMPSDAKNTGIIRVNHTHVDHVNAGLLFVHTVSHKPALVRSLGNSGILNKTSRYIKRRNNHAS